MQVAQWFALLIEKLEVHGLSPDELEGPIPLLRILTLHFLFKPHLAIDRVRSSFICRVRRNRENASADHTIESQVVQTTSCLCSKDLLLGFIQCVFDFESLFS